MTSLALCLPVAQRLKSLDTPENNFNEVVYYLGDFPWIFRACTHKFGAGLMSA
jgi:hypothetical protein